MKLKNVLYFSAVVFAVAFTSSACNKKKDTIAKVFVYDENKNPVSNAEVILKAEPTDVTYGKTLIENDTVMTNLSGEAIFNYNDIYEKGQAGVAVLNIYASKDGLTGEGVVQIVEEETSEATVYIK